jgi:hypothetical protein
LQHLFGDFDIKAAILVILITLPPILDPRSLINGGLATRYAMENECVALNLLARIIPPIPSVAKEGGPGILPDISVIILPVGKGVFVPETGGRVDKIRR